MSLPLLVADLSASWVALAICRCIPCAWRFQYIPSIACRNYKDFCILQSNRNGNAMDYVAWLSAVIGGSATIRPRFLREILLKDLAGLGEPARHHVSCACVARILPEARLSVRLGFLTKHYIVHLLMKDQFQKWFNDIFRKPCSLSMQIYRCKHIMTCRVYIYTCVHIIVIRYVMRSPLRPLARPCNFDASISCYQNPKQKSS